MSRLPLTMAAVNCDRFQALMDGTVRPEGIDLEIVPLEVEEVFYRQSKYAEFDISEMSMSTYTLSMGREDFPYIAIPVFPSRYFRHQSMFINTRSGIERPADVRGKKVGVPEYQITAGVWQRGIMEDEYGVQPRDIAWFSGGVDHPGREEKRRLTLPDDVRVKPIEPEQTLSQMLAEGELDAIFSAHEPRAFQEHEHVVRLFPDYKAAEKDYYARTGIFPIMHLVVIRRTVLDAHPWIARSLVKAFEASLEEARRALFYRSSLKVMLPWLANHVEETIDALGPDYWAYGIESNRKVLETFLGYHHAQGLSPRRYAPEELFAPSASGSFVI